MTGKRHAVGAHGALPRHSKKHKTTAADAPTGRTPGTPGTPGSPATKVAAASRVAIPATPGSAVVVGQLSSGVRSQQTQTQTQTRTRTQSKPGRSGPSSGTAPSTLPLQPHADILDVLRPKYNVRTLSVLSSSSMEKRIRAILVHLASPSATATSDARPVQQQPGVVLLYARAADANKLVSIVEIVKRHIREGRVDDADAPTGGAAVTGGKNKGAARRPKRTPTAWYQYNRVYDVQTVAKEEPRQEPAAADADPVGAENKGEDADEDEDEEDDAFEPVAHRFAQATGALHGPGRTVLVTYMSTILSRTPIVELQAQPHVSVQCSGDPIEVEYERWMART